MQQEWSSLWLRHILVLSVWTHCMFETKLLQMCIIVAAIYLSEGVYRVYTYALTQHECNRDNTNAEDTAELQKPHNRNTITTEVSDIDSWQWNESYFVVFFLSAVKCLTFVKTWTNQLSFKVWCLSVWGGETPVPLQKDQKIDHRKYPPPHVAVA